MLSMGVWTYGDDTSDKEGKQTVAILERGCIICNSRGWLITSKELRERIAESPTGATVPVHTSVTVGGVLTVIYGWLLEARRGCFVEGAIVAL